MRKSGDFRESLSKHAREVEAREGMMFALPIGAKLMVVKAHSGLTGQPKQGMLDGFDDVAAAERAPIEGIKPLVIGDVLLKIENWNDANGSKMIKCRDESGHVRLIMCDYLSNEAVEVLEAL